MKKNKVSKLNPLILALVGFVPFSSVLADWYVPSEPSLYGPMRPSDADRAIILFKVLFPFLALVVLVIGLVIYFKKRKRINDKKNSEIRKS